MPAFVNKRFGESGSKLEEGTMVCFFSLKKSRKVCRISSVFIFEQPQNRKPRISQIQREIADWGNRIPVRRGSLESAVSRESTVEHNIAKPWRTACDLLPTSTHDHRSAYRFFASSSSAAFTVSSSSA